MVDGNKVAKAHGQAARFDGDLFLTAVARWDNYRPMRLTLCFWQQGDKRLLRGLAAGLGFEPAALPVASTSPAFIATSQSKRSASSM